MNLYVPSAVTWKQGGARVTLTQKTSYPNNGDIAMHLKMDRAAEFAVNLRVPAWAGPGSTVKVNGRQVDGIALLPGTWAKVARTWKDGDSVELSLAMPLRLMPLDATHPKIVALVKGPVALFAVNPEPAS